MQWYIEGINAHMVEDVEFIKDDRMVDVIEDVIRLRGGLNTTDGPVSSRTRSKKRARYDTGFTLEVGNAGFRLRGTRTVHIQDSSTPEADRAPYEVVRHIKTQKLLYTAYSYNMSPVMYCGVNYSDICRPGVGPALYWTTNEILASGGIPNPQLGWIRPYVTPNSDGIQLTPNSANGIIYVFCADWLGAEMQTDSRYQLSSTYANYLLGWAPTTTTVTTDPNTPITYQDLSSNADWSRIRHFCTQITFNIVNLAPYPYVVEILFFKFNVDPSDLNYQDMQNAPICNQYQQMHAYCNGGIQQFGTPQIKVVKRKRIFLYGLDNDTYTASNTGLNVGIGPIMNAQHSNRAQFQFKIYRQYDICRGIHQNGQSLTETTFFNYYYDANEAVWCRVQAWPYAPFWGLPQSGSAINTEFPYLINVYDSACLSNSPLNLSVVKPAVHVQMEKRSYLKVDSPILKGPFRTD